MATLPSAYTYLMNPPPKGLSLIVQWNHPYHNPMPPEAQLVYIKTPWKKIEPSRNVFDWSSIHEVLRILPPGVTATISVNAGIATPPWVLRSSLSRSFRGGNASLNGKETENPCPE